MRVVFISPDFPENFFHFCTELAGRGHQVLGLSATPYERLRPELRDALTEYYRVDTLDHIDSLRGAIRHFLGRWGPIDAIESLNEHWLETEAQLRAEFGVPGWKPQDMAPIKRKSVMKQHFVDAGLDVAPGRILRSRGDLDEFVAQVGFPVVAKPDIGVGAARTYKIAEPADAEHFWATKPEADYFAEAYVTGRITTFDGLTNSRAEVVLATSMEYSDGVMETVNDDTDIYFSVVREVAPDLFDAGQRVAHQFDVRQRYFHFEFFRRPDGGLTALEVNMRPPGNLCVDMANYAHDLSMFAQWAEILTNDRVTAQPSGANHCTYVSRKESRSYALDDDQAAATYAHMLTLRTRPNSLFSSIMGNRGFLLRSPDMEQIAAAARDIQRPA